MDRFIGLAYLKVCFALHKHFLETKLLWNNLTAEVLVQMSDRLKGAEAMISMFLKRVITPCVKAERLYGLQMVSLALGAQVAKGYM